MSSYVTSVCFEQDCVSSLQNDTHQANKASVFVQSSRLCERIECGRFEQKQSIGSVLVDSIEGDRNLLSIDLSHAAFGRCYSLLVPAIAGPKGARLHKQTNKGHIWA